MREPSHLTSPAAALSPASDGRRRRSTDSRARIVAAMLELVREGDVSPGAEAVAARAAVGLRTVFRHFRDMDSLYAEMAAVIEAQLRPVAERPFCGDTWQARVFELLDRRADAFEATAPFKTAADYHRNRSPLLASGAELLTRALRTILLGVLPPELADDPVRREGLDLALSYEAWGRLRREQGLSPVEAKAVVRGVVERLIAP
jgi:AcrR family transcriptional regulator